MTILLFGVSNVGKSTVGKLLAQKLGIKFYDLDDEIKKKYKMTLEEFVNTGTLVERDNKRCTLLNQLASESISDKVIAVTPLSHIELIEDLVRSSNVISIELCDSAESIFDRLVFSDENDVIYKDDEYKNKHKDHYMEYIIEDQEWYGKIYSTFCTSFDMSGDIPEVVVDRLLQEFNLSSRR